MIDSGLARISSYEPRRAINTLLIRKISRAAAEQRAGRAGRTAPGRAFRLWSEADHARRAEFEAPEVHRVDLAEAVLLLKAAGVAEIRGFPLVRRAHRSRARRAPNTCCTTSARSMPVATSPRKARRWRRCR